MKTGVIYKFRSSKVIARDSRNKFHICISIGHGLFLYINSSPYPGCLKITRTDWPEMPNEVSYVSCNACVRYNKIYLKSVPMEECGKLTTGFLNTLLKHIDNSDQMPGHDIDDIVCELAEHLK